MKRILVIVPSLKLGGQEKVAAETAQILSDRYETKLVVFHNNDAVFHPDCEIISLNLPASGNIFGKVFNVIRRTGKLRKLKKEFHINVAYSFGDSANLVNALSKGKDKCLIGIRSYMSLLKDKESGHFVFCRADGIVSVSKMLSWSLKNRFPDFKNKIITLCNPYDITKIEKQSEEDVEIDTEGFLIGAMGRLDKVKGLGHLLRAAAMLVRDSYPVKVMIIGEGEERQALEKEAEVLGIADYVIFTGQAENPYKYLKKCSLFVLSSVHEGFPNALVEAMACGLPVIATDCKTGPKEILCETLTEIKSYPKWSDYGILTAPFREMNNSEPEKEKMLMEVIKELLLDETKRKFYGERARERAAMFSKEEYVRKLFQIIEEL